jgi:orotate phosphoribosyltransferase
MTDRREKIAELYFRSSSIKFGQFRLSAHQDNPDLPLSPYYLHYPKPEEPGHVLMPELAKLVGEEFFHILEAHDPVIKPKRIAGVPMGAVPLANEHASHYDDYPNNLLRFKKIEVDGRTAFVLGSGTYELGDELVIDEDHTSGGRNKRLIRAAAITAGLAVSTMLTVVDRQQGGPENMAREGVELLPIFTVTDLVEFGLQAGDVTTQQTEAIEEYRLLNQY